MRTAAAPCSLRRAGVAGAGPSRVVRPSGFVRVVMVAKIRSGVGVILPQGCACMWQVNVVAENPE